MKDDIFNNNCEGIVKDCKILITKPIQGNPNLKIIISKENNIITKGLWIDSLTNLLRTRKQLFSILKQNNIFHSKNIKLYKLISLVNNLDLVNIEVHRRNKYLELK